MFMVFNFILLVFVSIQLKKKKTKNKNRSFHTYHPVQIRFQIFNLILIFFTSL